MLARSRVFLSCILLSNFTLYQSPHSLCHRSGLKYIYPLFTYMFSLHGLPITPDLLQPSLLPICSPMCRVNFETGGLTTRWTTQEAVGSIRGALLPRVQFTTAFTDCVPTPPNLFNLWSLTASQVGVNGLTEMGRFWNSS